MTSHKLLRVVFTSSVGGIPGENSRWTDTSRFLSRQAASLSPSSVEWWAARLGTIVEASSHNVQFFITGAVFYQVCAIHMMLEMLLTVAKIGYTTIVLLVEVIVADITSLKSRLFYIYIPNLPFVVREAGRYFMMGRSSQG